jgi:hypothetical protein
MTPSQTAKKAIKNDVKNSPLSSGCQSGIMTRMAKTRNKIGYFKMSIYDTF